MIQVIFTFLLISNACGNVLPSYNISYNQRYATCAELKRHPVHELSEKFLKLGRPGGLVREAALIRIGKWNNKTDIWLSICTYIVEASSEHRKRDVILHVQKINEKLVPIEFHALVISFDDNDLHKIITTKLFENTYNNGDIAISSTVITRPQYEFVWVFEEDCRYIGSWNILFDKLENNDKTDLFLWSSNLLTDFKKGLYKKGEWWHRDEHWGGQWAKKSPKMRGAWTMGFRMSHRLAATIYFNAQHGTLHRHQEVNIITQAHEAGYIVRVDDYSQKREWECCRLGQAGVMYKEFIQNPSKKLLPNDFLMHKIDTQTHI